jgi:hypothetical protein
MSLTSNTLLPLSILLLAGSANSQPPPPAAASQSMLARTFWAGLGQINMLFNRAGSLASGAARGAVWRLDLGSGKRQRIGTTDTLSWPVAATSDGPVFALHGRQLVRLAADGTEAPVGDDGAWRKLLGVLPDGRVLGFVVGAPRARPALLSHDHVIHIVPLPESDQERRREAIALQEDRDYAGGKRLVVRRSERGGEGFDIYLIEGSAQRNMTDCGNDRCGQPSLTGDGLAMLYIRAEP